MEPQVTQITQMKFGFVGVGVRATLLQGVLHAFCLILPIPSLVGGDKDGPDDTASSHPGRPALTDDRLQRRGWQAERGPSLNLGASRS